MRRRGVRRPGGPKRETVWTAAQIAQDSVDSAAVSTLNLVDSTDWSRGSTSSFQRGATLERIRGSLCVNFGGAVTSAAGALWLAIWAINDSETSPDPTVVNDYVEEDLLWARTINATTTFLTSVGYFVPIPIPIDIDVKARRKLDTNTIILLTWRATGASSDENFILSGIVRALVKLP